MNRPLHTVDPFCKSHKPEDRPLPPEEKRRCGVEDREHALSELGQSKWFFERYKAALLRNVFGGKLPKLTMRREA